MLASVEHGRTCSPGCRWNVRGHGHGSIQKGPAAPGGCVSLPSTLFPGQRGSGASACELEMPLTSACPGGGRSCWATGSRQGSQPGSMLTQPGLLPAIISFSPSSGVRAPVTVGHKSPSARSHSQCARELLALLLLPQKFCTAPLHSPRSPRDPQGCPLGTMDMGGRFPSHFPLAEWD